MSWNDTPVGSILGATKKSDFDRIFDNQQRLKDEFSQQHQWAASGSVDGKHNGVQQWKATGTIAAGLGETNAATLASTALDNGFYELNIAVYNETDTKWFFVTVPILDSFVSRINAYFYTKVTTVKTHPDNSNCTNAAPVNYPYLHIYPNAAGDSLLFDIRTTGLAASTRYFFSLHQLADFSV